MESNIYSYENEEIKVTWDKKRCIHAKECVHGLPEVFDIEQKPWIQPGKSSTDSVAETVMRCPTGALQFERKDGGQSELAPEKNSLKIEGDGPLYIHGAMKIEGVDGTTFTETRAAFCRCGQSQNKPYCDNSHIKAEFKADTSFSDERLKLEETEETGGELSIRVLPNAPFVIEGTYSLQGEEQTINTKKKMSFCRCGASRNKPFCDGAHKVIGFEG
ncbi:MAG: hypothetical protein ED557_08670 [Balneola sp.]|nr:MAG: hypothetical protein ED557_08670 [Balneola sp.]